MHCDNKLEIICLYMLAAEILEKDLKYFDLTVLNALTRSQPVVAEYVADLPQDLTINELLCMILNKTIGCDTLH